MTERIKLAGGSADPAQQHLRNQKRLWNKTTRSLISKLIAFKRGLNGAGDPQAGIPASKIQFPLPAEVSSLLSNIADEYAAIIQGGEQIIQEQEHYSQVRRQPRPKQQPGAVPTQPAPLSADDGMLAEASWFGSRMWANTLGLRGKDRRYIRAMLRAADSIKDHLLDLENILSSRYDNSIPDAVREALNLGNLPYNNLMTAFLDMCQSNYNLKLSDLPTELESPAPSKAPSLPQGPVPEKAVQAVFERDRFDAIKKERRTAEGILGLLEEKKLLPNEQLVGLRQIFARLNHDRVKFHSKREVTEEQAAERNVSFFEYVSARNELLARLSQLFANGADVSFSDILTAVKQAKAPTESLQAVAHNLLSRRFKQFLMKNLPKSRKVRDQVEKQIALIDRGIEPALKAVEELIDQLETSGSRPQEDIWPKLQLFMATFARIYEDISQLAHAHNNKYREELITQKPIDVNFHKIVPEELALLKKMTMHFRHNASKVLL